MPSRSKQKGNRFEREVVNIAKQNNAKVIIQHDAKDFSEMPAVLN